MAYAGGYAGGYADSLIPPVPEVPTYGGGPAPARRETHLRTRTRYRLTIIGDGATSHHDTPLGVGATVGGNHTHHRAQQLAGIHAEATAEQSHRSRASYHARPTGTGTIPDPDEWVVVFL